MLFSASSCSKEQDETKATIFLEDTSGAPVSGITVYAYTISKWNTFGDNNFFADKTVSSDVSGACEIILDDIIGLFAFDSQETIYFSAHYTLNNVEKRKFISITFSEGQTKSGTIILD